MRFLSALAMTVILTGLQASSGQAQELDPASMEALTKTQDLLKNPAIRQQAIQGDAAAQAADAQVRALAGRGIAPDQVYELSNDVMADLVKQTGGDPAKMQAIVERAKADPASLKQYLSEPSREKIRQLAK